MVRVIRVVPYVGVGCWDAMGVIAYTVIRGLFYLQAFIINIVASIIIVRRLDAVSYALYQTIVKRVANYAMRLPGLYSLWLYRYTVSGVRGAVAAGVLLSLLASCVAAILGGVVAVQLGASTPVALLAAAASAAMVFWAGIVSAVDARHPLRVALALFGQRLVFSVLVVLLVYVWGAGVEGVFAAATFSHMLAIVLGLYWLKGDGDVSWPGLRVVLKVVVEWFRRIYVTALRNIAVLIESFDVALVYVFSSARVVAAFFAVTNIFIAMTDAVRASFRYVQGFVLSTEDYRSAVNAIRVTALLSAPFLVYSAVYPLHLVSLLNPAYSWAAIIAPLAAASSLVYTVAVGTLNLLAGLVKEADGSPRQLAKLYSVTVLSSTAYLGLLALGLPLSGSERGSVVVWATLFLMRNLMLISLLVYVAPLNIRNSLLRLLAWSLLVYPMLALLAALIFPPRGMPSPRFWETFWAMAPSAVGALLVYVALVLLIDKWARGLAWIVVKKLRAGAWFRPNFLASSS